MNYGIIIRVLGNLMRIESLCMVPSLIISICFRETDKKAFIFSILLTYIIGYVMSKVLPRENKIKIKEALAIVSLGWILSSILGSLPFIISGSIPSIIDAFFETVSGFTTTGATIINNVEALPHGILFWRSFTHWIGGMGILVFTVAILPAMGIGGFQIFKTESPGPITSKIVPKIKDTAKILYGTYLGITIIEIILLKLGGMNLFDSIVNTFGTVGTGGFSTKNSSIGAYNSTYIYLVIGIFMVASGINFSLYYELYKGRFKSIFKNQELKLYLGIIAASTLFIALDLKFNLNKALKDSFTHSFFQVSSIITTTGYSTVDFDKWTSFSKSILLMLMFVGGCAGSTAGGMKNIRILVLLKLVKREFLKILHPRAVIPVKIGNKTISSDTVSNIMTFIGLYIVIFVIGTIVVSLEGVDLISSSSAVASTLGNIGPGLGFVGPATTFGGFSGPCKLLLSFFMLLGRLELFTLLIMFSPNFWKNNA